MAEDTISLDQDGWVYIWEVNWDWVNVLRKKDKLRMTSSPSNWGIVLPFNKVGYSLGLNKLEELIKNSVLDTFE